MIIVVAGGFIICVIVIYSIWRYRRAREIGDAIRNLGAAARAVEGRIENAYEAVRRSILDRPPPVDNPTLVVNPTFVVNPTPVVNPTSIVNPTSVVNPTTSVVNPATSGSDNIDNEVRFLA